MIQRSALIDNRAYLYKGLRKLNLILLVSHPHLRKQLLISSPLMPVSKHRSPLFNDSPGDVIVRSTDGVDFRMFKVDLSRSSSVFGDMFSLAQPLGDCEVGLPVVPLTETSDVLALVLPFCISTPPPPCRRSRTRAKSLNPRASTTSSGRWTRSSLRRRVL